MAELAAPTFALNAALFRLRRRRQQRTLRSSSPSSRRRPPTRYFAALIRILYGTEAPSLGLQAGLVRWIAGGRWAFLARQPQYIENFAGDPIAGNRCRGPAAKVGRSRHRAPGLLFRSRPMKDSRILLVEDDPELGFLMTHVLRSAGYSVDVARTQREAWEHLDEHRYTLIIADWKLPDGDGTVIADAARELGAKTIVLSGYLLQMPGDRVDAHETLMKPVRPSELVEAVERSIRQRGTR